MARMPGARWLGEHSPGMPMERYDAVCVHTIVGHAPAHQAHFSTHHDGTIDQSRDTRYRSAANLEGNPRVIAIENEDKGEAFKGYWKNDSDVPPLTDAEVEACAKILAWAHKEHGIPLQLCPDSRPGSRGLAYHRQGIDGNFGDYDYPGRKPGGEVWSQARGKVCPGDRRIAQLPLILERAAEIVRGDPQPQPEPEPVFEEDAMFVSKFGRSLWVLVCGDGSVPTISVGTMRSLTASGEGYQGLPVRQLSNATITSLRALWAQKQAYLIKALDDSISDEEALAKADAILASLDEVPAA